VAAHQQGDECAESRHPDRRQFRNHCQVQRLGSKPFRNTFHRRVTSNAPPEGKMGFTKRELDILTFLSEGLVKKEIADQLDISPHTVAEHVKHIYEKLNVKNAPAAIAKAYKSGLF
jgi:DNA-binding NarL/FixJ family response regulator